MTAISVNTNGVDQRFVLSFQRNAARTRTAVERLSTGKRINRPSDDPAGFVAAEELRGELSDLRIKLKNLMAERQNVRTRQTGLASVQSALYELRDRVVSAADGVLTVAEKDALQAEISEAAEAVSRIAKLTGIKGAEVQPKIADQLTKADAAAVEYLDGRVRGNTSERASLGAYERTHLDVFQRLYEDQIVITTQTLSLIEDTDYAAETANLVQSQVLSQGAIAALSYANRQRVDQLAVLLDKIA
jgi:flagellin